MPENQNKKNHSTFTRSPHDRENPYVMINGNMLRDKSISPKAKGILAYLLSFGGDWQFYHWKICEDLNIGEEYLNSGINELIKAGYIKRTRMTSPDGRKTPYHYEIAEFKKFLPDRVFRPGKAGPENPVLLNNQDNMNIKKTTTAPQQEDPPPQADEPIVVVFFKSLDKLKISEPLKFKISNTYTEQQVDLAVERCLKWTKRESDEAALLFTLRNPETWNDVISKEEIHEKNRQFLKTLLPLDNKPHYGITIYVGSSYIEFINGTNGPRFEITQTDMIAQVQKHLKKIGINI